MIPIQYLLFNQIFHHFLWFNRRLIHSIHRGVFFPLHLETRVQLLKIEFDVSLDSQVGYSHWALVIVLFFPAYIV
jgi:hypothetical protein